MNYVEKSILKGIYRNRPTGSHKGEFGNVLVIGGNYIYSGTVALVSKGALRAGADLTCIVAPERTANIAATFSENIITYPLKGNHITEKHLKEIFSLLPRYDSIVIGNGMGLEPETKKAVLKFIKELDKPCVIDADAIKMLSGMKLNKNFVLTPHAVEFSILTGELCAGNTDTNIKAVQSAAKKFGCTILLKGNPDIISDGENTICNRTGNSYMTKGGTGDVLAGVCGGILARRVKPFEAACAAAYINGAAGDLAAKDFGEGLLATDVIDYIVKIMK